MVNVSQRLLLDVVRPFVFPYFINGTVLVSILNEVRDLGFIIASSISLKAHVDQSYSIIRFLLKELLLNPNMFVLCALVRPLLEYGFVVWSTHSAIYTVIKLCAHNENFLAS